MECRINKDTQLCMSLSARPGNFGTRFQNFLFREKNLNFVYKAFTTHDLRAAIGGIRALGIRGCAVSMPFKEACIGFIDEMDPSAQGIESVNTIVNTGGHLKAYNTDYTAVLTLLQSGPVMPDASFALLGSGGMAKAVACALSDTGFKSGWVVSRNEKAGAALAAKYGFEWAPNLGTERPELLVNATPIGMAGGREADQLAFSEASIRGSRTVFDVVAVPEQTPLIRLARDLGRATISGADVIILQAVEQFVLYTGCRPDAGLMARAADFALGR